MQHWLSMSNFVRETLELEREDGDVYIACSHEFYPRGHVARNRYNQNVVIKYIMRREGTLRWYLCEKTWWTRLYDMIRGALWGTQ